MPTGSGKSLCYHLPGAMAVNQITVVVEPLLSLMKNQLDYLRSLKIPAETINSQTSDKERNIILGDLKAKITRTRFLYITPEQAETPRFKELFATLVKFRKIAYFAGKLLMDFLNSQPKHSSTFQLTKRIVSRLGVMTFVQNTCCSEHCVEIIQVFLGSH